MSYGLEHIVQQVRDTSTGGNIWKVKNATLNTLIEDLTSVVDDLTSFAREMHPWITGKTHYVFSNRGVRTTISSTRHDTDGVGVNRIYFVTDGALTTVSDTAGYIALSTAIDSSSTYTAGSYLFVRDSKKVVCSSHGAQMIYLNS